MPKNYNYKRHAMRFNAFIALLLAGLLLGMFNYLSARHNWRRDFSHAQYYTLSPVTRDLLKSIPGEIRITALMAADHEIYRDLRGILLEYAHASNKVKVEFVDPNRDLARAKEAVLRHDITEPNYLLFEIQGRTTSVPLRDMADYDYTPMLSGRPKVMTEFRAEQVISSAIHNLAQTTKPLVGFLTGHGEKSIENHDPLEGYSMIARQIRRNNIETKTISLEAGGLALTQCNALVIAGPVRRLPQAEVEMLAKYLNDAGRVFLLLDSGVDAGLDDLLAEWGIRVGDDRVVGLTLTGRELLVNNYSAHPITARMQNLTTIFNIPRSVQPLIGITAPADRPRVTMLAATTEKGWADNSAYQDPPKFDPETDQPGPIAVALAVERGPVEDINMELPTARLVVFGDSTLVANGALRSGYNPDLFINSINWLLEHRQGLNIPVRRPPAMRIFISRTNLHLLYAILGAGLPFATFVIGLLVWWRRRK